MASGTGWWNRLVTDATRTIDRWVSIVLTALVATYLVGMFQYPFKAYIVPVIVASVTLIASVVQVVAQLRASSVREESTAGADDLGRLGRDGRRRLLFVFVWIWLLLGAILTLGFVVGPGLMAFLLMRFEKETWAATVFVAGSLTGIAYLLMTVILELPVLDGLVWDLWG